MSRIIPQERQMRRTMMCLLASVPIAASAQSSALAVRQIPIRTIDVLGTATEPLGPQASVRALADGSMLVNDVARRRVLLFNAALSHFAVVLDSATNSASAQSSAQLIPYGADSTLFVDMSTQALLVLGPNGKVARVMALPKPRDARFIAGSVLGDAHVDARGGLIYRALYPPTMKPSNSDSVVTFPSQPDSVPILRADFETRTIDTIAAIKVPQSEAMTQTRDGMGNVTMRIVLNPMSTGDEWAMLTDGTIAIVRAHDYHIDWIDTDRTRRSTPKMPFDLRAISQEEKQSRLDSLRVVLQKQLDAAPARTIETPDGRRQLRTQFDFVPLRDLSDYEPPIGPGSAKADLSNHLWVLPHTSASASNGLLYDVINKRGEIEYRVQLPSGFALVGFGTGNDVFLLQVTGKTGKLARARVH